METHISKIEFIFYKGGSVNLINIDGESFYPTGPTEEDTSVYIVKIDRSFKKNVAIAVYAMEENITELYKAEARLPDKVTTEAFTIIFTEGK